MKHLQLPPTLRTATIDEIPNTEENKEWLKEREVAKIIQGYTLETNENLELPFKFYSEINIDNPNLWELFWALAFTLPNEACFIFSHADEEPSFSPYTNKKELLGIVSNYSKELSQDGFIEFGIVYQDSNILEEVFVKKSKFIQYWGSDHQSFLDIMIDFELTQIHGLNFIDEFPLVTIPLNIHDPSVLETQILLENLRQQILR